MFFFYLSLPTTLNKPAEYLLQREDDSELDNQSLTYSGLAESLGLSYNSIYGKMRGKTCFTDADKTKLVEIFGKPIEYLLERTKG